MERETFVELTHLQNRLLASEASSIDGAIHLTVDEASLQELLATAFEFEALAHRYEIEKSLRQEWEKDALDYAYQLKQVKKNSINKADNKNV